MCRPVHCATHGRFPVNKGPSRHNLPTLQGLNDREYGRWLLVGITRFLVDGDGADSFSGAANYVARLGSIEQDLAIIFDALNRPEQASFRAGIRIALGELTRQPDHLLLVGTHLLRLAAVVSAFEVVEVLPSLVAAARHLPEADREDISSLALDVAIELAVPTLPARDVLRGLVTATGFAEAVAGPALIALTRADPNGLPGHLDLLWKPLSEKYAALRPSAENPWLIEERDELFAQLATYAPADTFWRATRPSERAVATTSDWYHYDWFCRGLMASAHPAVRPVAEKVLLLEEIHSKDQGESLPDPSFGRRIFAFSGNIEYRDGRQEAGLESIVEATMGPPPPAGHADHADEDVYALEDY